MDKKIVYHSQEMREKRGNNAQYQKDINGWPACSDGSRLRRHRDKSALRDEIDC